MDKQILLFGMDNKSAFDGKTVNHAIRLDSNVFIGFADGTWGVLEGYGSSSSKANLRDIEHNLVYLDNASSIIFSLIRIGVFSSEDGDHLIAKIKNDKREQLVRNIKDYEERTEQDG